jgi:hypothetical protein
VFVPVRPFQPSLIFDNARAFPFRLLALPTNNSLSWKGLPGTNTLAHHKHLYIRAIKVLKGRRHLDGFSVHGLDDVPRLGGSSSGHVFAEWSESSNRLKTINTRLVFYPVSSTICPHNTSFSLQSKNGRNKQECSFQGSISNVL